MRWRPLRRRFSNPLPRMSVRSHLPWPLRWAMLAMMFGFSAAIATWAFDFGTDIAGVDRDDGAELARLRDEVAQLRGDRERTQALASATDSLLKADQAATQRLAQQIRQLEAENLSLKADLGFFERLLPAVGDGMNVRALHAELEEPGRLRYQLLVMHAGRTGSFSGRYDVQLSGTLDGQPWSYSPPDGARSLQFRQYGRVEGLLDHPAEAVVQQVQVRVLDASGGVRATQTVKL